jgi:hypothetical protein
MASGAGRAEVATSKQDSLVAVEDFLWIRKGAPRGQARAKARANSGGVAEGEEKSEKWVAVMNI